MEASRTVAVGPHIDEAAWLQERAKRLTGSKIAAIFGVHPYVSAADVQREALEGPEEQAESEVMRRGKLMEPIAVSEYERLTGRRTRRVPMRAWYEDPLFASTVDRQVLAGPDNPTAVLEAKALGWRTFSEVRRKGLLPYMIYQGQLEALCYGVGFTSFAVFHPDSLRTLTFDLQADFGFQQAMVQRGREWWTRHVINREPVAAARPIEQLPEVSGEILQRTDEIFGRAALELLEARDIRKEAEELEGEAKSKLKAVLGAFGAFEGAGARIYYRQQPGRTSFDRKALEKCGPLDPAKVQAWLGDRFGDIGIEELREAADGLRLDLSDFEKQGVPFEEIRPYRMKASEL